MKKLTLLLILVSNISIAAPVSIILENGLTANANYQAGKENKPVIMVVHGFASTYNYGTIQSISNELLGKGYSVITPNLTLGVDNRNEPLSCDQPHKSSLSDEGKELAQWAKWLSSKNNNPLIMIGHSAGSSSILSSLESHPANLKQIILTAIYDFDDAPENALLYDKKVAQQNLQTGKLAYYNISFCRGNFFATSDVYLDYRHWNKERIIDTINRSSLPITVIMPGSDKRLEGNKAQWIEQLKQTKANIELIKNADHFFSSDAEFDLTESINRVLEHK